MKKKIGKKDDRSLKTFFLYAFMVFLIIFISLSIKAIFIIRQSKFGGTNINVSVSHNDRVVEVLKFDFAQHSESILKIKDDKVTTSSLGKDLGIMTEGRIISKIKISNDSPESMLMNALLGKNEVKTDLTSFDVLRLFIFSKSVTGRDKQTGEIKQPFNMQNSDKIVSTLFKDDAINSENISIEIINATNEPGLGKRLERCITNIGGNVVAVTTPHKPLAKSKIKYVGKKSYTTKKLNRLLKFPTEKINSASISKIVIIIGEDSKSQWLFE